MAKVFITSGTGYIGEAVAKSFKRQGHEVTALTRSEESAKRVIANGFASHQGDVSKPETYIEKLAEFDIVVHTAAVYNESFGAVEKQTAWSIINALKGTNKTFVYTSGSWVLGNTGDNPADENAKTQPIDIIQWRPALEQQILEASKQNIRTIVIRPAIVYGEGGGIFAQLIANAKKSGEAHYVGKAESHWSIVHVEDLANLYVLAATKAVAGSLYNAAERKAPQAAEYSQYVAEAAGVSGKTKSVSLDDAKKVFGGFAEGLALDQLIDASRANKDLGWAPKDRKLAEELKVVRKELVVSK